MTTHLKFQPARHPRGLLKGTRHGDLGQELVKRGCRVAIFAMSFHHYPCRGTRLQPEEQRKIEDKGGLRFIWPRTLPYCY